MKILIVGATGGTGRELVKQALDRGHIVTAFARNPADIAIQHERLSVVQGNVLDPGSVETAVKGQDAVLSALGHKRWMIPSSILSQGTRVLVDAMKRQGVRRLICETSLGVGDSRGRLGLYYTLFVIPVIVFFYFRDKKKQEDVIRQSGLDWVIVRPGRLTNGRKREEYRHGSKVGNYIWTVSISRADVADFMLSQLENDRYVHQAVGVAY
ncbi:MAG: SDR family oxidoreductase [Bacteroidota bacterium]